MSDTRISAARRRQVREAARERCEYCLVPEIASLFAHPIDHIIAEKHGGSSEFENLALSCVLCNGFKGSDIASIDPSTSEITPLFNPRVDRWDDHFRMMAGWIEAKTAKGRVTIRLLRLNDASRIAEREMFRV